MYFTVRKKGYLTRGQFSELVGVSKETLKYWEDSGKLLPHETTEGGWGYYIKDQKEQALELKAARHKRGFMVPDNGLISRRELSKMIGVTVEAIGRWDAKGLLVPYKRSEGGHRFYHKDQITRALELRETYLINKEKRARKHKES